jgi:uncharacterized cupin superfamily protein
MEVAPGIFVSKLSTDDWHADPEVGGMEHVFVGEPDGFAGMSRFDVGSGDPEPWTVPVRQVVLVLEGSARIEVDGGPTIEVGVGDLFSLPAGARTRWHLTKPYRELWVFSRFYDEENPEG